MHGVHIFLKYKGGASKIFMTAPKISLSELGHSLLPRSSLSKVLGTRLLVVLPYTSNTFLPTSEGVIRASAASANWLNVSPKLCIEEIQRGEG